MKRKVHENKNNKLFSNESRIMKRENMFKHQKALFQNTASSWTNFKFIRNMHKVEIGNEKISLLSIKLRIPATKKQCGIK